MSQKWWHSWETWPAVAPISLDMIPPPKTERKIVHANHFRKSAKCSRVFEKTFSPFSTSLAFELRIYFFAVSFLFSSPSAMRNCLTKPTSGGRWVVKRLLVSRLVPFSHFRERIILIYLNSNNEESAPHKWSTFFRTLISVTIARLYIGSIYQYYWENEITIPFRPHKGLSSLTASGHGLRQFKQWAQLNGKRSKNTFCLLCVSCTPAHKTDP